MLLLTACASPASRLKIHSNALMPKSGLNSLKSVLSKTGDGKYLLETIRPRIQLAYDLKGAFFAEYSCPRNKRGKTSVCVISLNPKLKTLPPTHPLTAMVTIHELTHIAQEALPLEKRVIRYYMETDAYSAGMRAWLELDPKKQYPIPHGLMRDFENADIAETLNMLRSSYERGLEEFVDMINLRYHRLCLAQYPHDAAVCGKYQTLQETLSTAQDPLIKQGWEMLRQKDAVFRAPETNQTTRDN